MLSLALFASGCGGSGGLFGGPDPTTSAVPSAKPAAPASSTLHWLGDDLSSFFVGSSGNAPEQVAGASPAAGTSPNAAGINVDTDCPFIQIRQGAATLTVSEAGVSSAALALKYQGTFVRAARQCAVVGGQMNMKVGVQGRIIVGPAGGPGELDVPLRIAVVDQKPGSSKTIVTKLIMIPVTVSSANDNPSFTHVEDGLNFPLPSAAALERYIVFIGFDPLAAEAHARKPKPRPRHKRKPELRLRPTPGTG
jgi:hypothetical protein